MIVIVKWSHPQGYCVFADASTDHLTSFYPRVLWWSPELISSTNRAKAENTPWICRQSIEGHIRSLTHTILNELVF